MPPLLHRKFKEEHYDDKHIDKNTPMRYMLIDVGSPGYLTDDDTSALAHDLIQSGLLGKLGYTLKIKVLLSNYLLHLIIDATD
jgi:hypothetical protein